MINREGFEVADSSRECTKCGTVFTRTNKTVALCHACNSSRVKAMGEVGKMLRRAKSRAKLKGIEFSLTAEDVKIPAVCPILGIKLEHIKGQSGGHDASPALDRIDNSLGYIKGNVMVISNLANRMKSSADKQTLLTFAKWILSTHSRHGVTNHVE
jgi:predicted Zn-ribbon and HTH transcriptional regulator